MNSKAQNQICSKQYLLSCLVGTSLLLFLGFLQYLSRTSMHFKEDNSVTAFLPLREVTTGIHSEGMKANTPSFSQSDSRTTPVATPSGYAKAEHQNVTRMCALKERLDYLRSMCNQLNASAYIHPKSRFIVDDKRKLVYCSISKAGCTQWKGLMQAANTGNKQYLSQQGLVHSGKGMAEAKLRRIFKWNPSLDSYSKVLVVRNPFDRALSAYRNVRVGLANMGPGPNVYKSLKRVFPNSSSGGNKVDKLSFQEFMTFLTTPDLTPPTVYTDRHFLPMVHSCDICNIKYDYFLRLETLKVDSAPVLEILDFPANFLETAPTLNKGKTVKTVNGSTPFGSYSKFLPEYENISFKIMNKFIARYRLDLELLGYHYIEDSHIASCSISLENGEVCC